MRRREFLAGIGGAAVWPNAARPQQPSMPVVGYLSSFAPDVHEKYALAFRKGLNEGGFLEERNVRIQFRLAEQGRYDRLPQLAFELISQKVAVLFATPINAALAAKTATTVVPTVFAIGSDPVDMGLVSTLNRPGGNTTGATFLSSGLGAKRLELLRELVPNIVSVALLVNPNNPTTAMQTKDTEDAARALGLQLNVLHLASPKDLEAVFGSLAQRNINALVVSADSLFSVRRKEIVEFTTAHAVPVIYSAREYAEAGGLISYASDYSDSFRAAAVYVGRILRGESPADLPVIQPTKFELVINQKAAKAMRLHIPDRMLALADEVIE